MGLNCSSPLLTSLQEVSLQEAGFSITNPHWVPYMDEC